MTKKKPVPTDAEFMPTTQPADWLAAFRAEADRQGTKLSIWVGEQCRKGLPPAVRKTLSTRTQGRPKKNPE